MWRTRAHIDSFASDPRYWPCLIVSAPHAHTPSRSLSDLLALPKLYALQCPGASQVQALECNAATTAVPAGWCPRRGAPVPIRVALAACRATRRLLSRALARL